MWRPHRIPQYAQAELGLVEWERHPRIRSLSVGHAACEPVYWGFDSQFHLPRFVRKEP